MPNTALSIYIYIFNRGFDAFEANLLKYALLAGIVSVEEGNTIVNVEERNGIVSAKERSRIVNVEELKDIEDI